MRGKDARAHLIGSACEVCEEFYKVCVHAEGGHRQSIHTRIGTTRTLPGRHRRTRTLTHTHTHAYKPTNARAVISAESSVRQAAVPTLLCQAALPTAAVPTLLRCCLSCSCCCSCSGCCSFVRSFVRSLVRSFVSLFLFSGFWHRQLAHLRLLETPHVVPAQAKPCGPLVAGVPRHAGRR